MLPAELLGVVRDKVPGSLRIRENLLSFGFTKGRHVEELCIIVGKSREVHSMNVIHQVRELLGDFLQINFFTHLLLILT